MLAHFNQLSLIGVAANLVVVPLAAAGTTLGMLALLVELVSVFAADLLFQALWLLLLALRAAVWVAAQLPAAMVYLPAPSWAAIAAWCAALALVPYLGGSRRWIQGTCAGLSRARDRPLRVAVGKAQRRTPPRHLSRRGPG
jgi:hypothetical protein